MLDFLDSLDMLSLHFLDNLLRLTHKFLRIHNCLINIDVVIKRNWWDRVAAKSPIVVIIAKPLIITEPLIIETTLVVALIIKTLAVIALAIEIIESLVIEPALIVIIAVLVVVGLAPCLGLLVIQI